MIIKFNNLMTVKILKKIMKIRKIKYTNFLNKSQIITFLNNHECAKIIQTNFRKKTMSEKDCPISKEKLIYPFISFKINNKFIYYDFKTVINYFLKTRCFKDPLTREDIPDSVLEKINIMIKYYYGKNTNKILISDNMINHTELFIIIFCLNDMYNDINYKNELTIDDIYSNYIPRILYYINKLNNKQSKEVVKDIMSTFSNSLKCIKNIDIIKNVISEFI